MPVKKCEKDGKPGYKWGDSGACYTYTSGNEQSRKNAKKKAHKQGAAIENVVGESEFWKGAITGLTDSEEPDTL